MLIGEPGKEKPIPTSWLYVIKHDDTESKIFGSIKLVSHDALCDMQIYSSNIYTICNYGTGTENTGQDEDSGIQLN